MPLLLQGALGAPAATLLVFGLLASGPAFDLAIQLINAAVTRRLRPARLPRLELRGGVPPTLRTLVAVPTLLTTLEEIAEQVDRLEVHYLANPEDELRFALLSDWRDAAAEELPGDAGLLAAAVAGIARLNERHGPAPDGEARFLLLHRRRVWNAGERCWMGWERKRGKLEELNRLLRGATDTTFLSGEAAGPHGPRVPRGSASSSPSTPTPGCPAGAARRLVGTLAHPLNRPRSIPRRGRVVAGYGAPPAAGHPDRCRRTATARCSSASSRGRPASIPTPRRSRTSTRTCSAKGSFTGKGIYDVDAFEAALAGRVPENALLSHDLFEGLFARAGLVTDIELFEEFPVALRGRRRPPAPLGARATGSCCPGSSAVAPGRAAAAGAPASR